MKLSFMMKEQEKVINAVQQSLPFKIQHIELIRDGFSQDQKFKLFDGTHWYFLRVSDIAEVDNRAKEFEISRSEENGMITINTVTIVDADNNNVDGDAGKVSRKRRGYTQNRSNVKRSKTSNNSSNRST